MSEGDSPLSLTQYTGLIVAVSFSSTLSTLGSCCILWMARFKLDNPYHRLMFGMCCADILFSLSCVLQPWLQPADVPLPYATGTTVSCSFVGYIFSSFATTVALYSAFLSLNFFLTVCYKWSERKIAVRCERKAHIVAWVFPQLFMIPAVSLGTINPAQFSQVCLFDVYPTGCDEDDAVECSRGQYQPIFRLIQLLTLGIASVVGFFSTFRVYSAVRRTFAASRRHSFQVGANILTEKRIRLVKTQAILYSIAYLNTIIWPIAMTVIGALIEADGQRESKALYALRVVSFLLYPMQGFFNFFIYIRPAFNAWRDADPQLSAINILPRVLKLEEPPRQSSTLEGGSDNQALNDSGLPTNTEIIDVTASHK